MSKVSTYCLLSLVVDFLFIAISGKDIYIITSAISLAALFIVLAIEGLKK